MEKYLQENWNEISRKVRNVTQNHQNYKDLLNDLVVNLLEKDEEYKAGLLERNKVQHWFTTAAKTQVNSKTSPFYYKYKSFQHRTNDYQEWKHIEVDEDTTDFEKGQEIANYIRFRLKSYTVYEQTLCTEHIINGKSFSEISREYKINRRYISETVSPVRQEIYEEIKQKWQW